MSTLRTTNVIHGSSAISNIVLDNQGRAIFGPDSPAGRAALYVNAQNNRVGVNTESPAVALDVDGAINATGNVAFGGTLSVTGNVSFNGTANFVGNVTVDTLEATTSLTVGVPGTAGVVANNGGYLFIRQPTVNGVAVDVYDASGPTASIRGNGLAKFEQIGVNTTTPDSKLQIVPDAVDTDIFTIRRQDSTTVNLFRFFQDSRIAGGTGCAHINTENRSLLMTASASGDIDSGMILTTTGRLGIGTTSPSWPLEVVSTSSSDAAGFRKSGSGTCRIRITAADSSYGTINVPEGETRLEFFAGTSLVSRHYATRVIDYTDYTGVQSQLSSFANGVGVGISAPFKQSNTGNNSRSFTPPCWPDTANAKAVTYLVTQNCWGSSGELGGSRVDYVTVWGTDAANINVVNVQNVNTGTGTNPSLNITRTSTELTISSNNAGRVKSVGVVMLCNGGDVNE